MGPVKAFIVSAAMASAGAWWENYAAIVPKEGELERNEPGLQVLELNPMQAKVCEIERWCRENGVPCRIIGLKGRQSGLSTISVGAGYHRLARKRGRGCIIGDEFEKSVKNLVRMFEIYAENDGLFRDKNPYSPESKTFANGSLLVTETANDPRAGASGTLQVVIGTEVAHWPDTEKRSAARVLAALLNCVPKLPDTLVILESTPNGMQGAYYDTYQGAVTFEEFKAGKRGNGFIKVFYAWHEHWEYQTPCTQEESEEIERTMDERELELVRKFNLPPERLKWRREKIAGPEFNGDWDKFNEEYPSDPESCFLASGRMAFDQEALTAIEKAGKAFETRHGVIEKQANSHRTIFRDTREVEAIYTVFEKPMRERRYIITADPATGEERAVGEDPDRHSVLVTKAGQWVPGQGWVPPTVVARIKAPCYVAMDVLADWIDRLSWYYGRCIVAFEINNSGLALHEALKPYNVPLYYRTVENFKKGTKQQMVGWDTSPAFRKLLVENIQKAVRLLGEPGEGIILPCANAIHEFRKFIINAKGKAIAARGHHDDDVITAAAGVTLQNFATTYNEQVMLRPMPRDLQRAIDAEERRGGAGRSQYS